MRAENPQIASLRPRGAYSAYHERLVVPKGRVAQGIA
jgi:hypothetical protein